MRESKRQSTLFVVLVFFIFSTLCFIFGRPVLAETVKCEYIPRDSSRKILYFAGSDANHQPWLREIGNDDCMATCALLKTVCSVSGGLFGGPIAQDPEGCDATYLTCEPTISPTLTVSCKFTPKKSDGTTLSGGFDVLTPSEGECQTLCNNSKALCTPFCGTIGSTLCCDEAQTTCETTTKTSPPPAPHQFGSITPRLEIPLPTLPSLSTFTDLTLQGEAPNRYFWVPWIGQYIAAIYKYAIGIVGILSGIMIVIGGLLWLTAGGAADRISTAKSFIESSLVGLVIALTSYVLLYAINPNLVGFEGLKIPYVEQAEMAGVEESSGTQTACPQVTPLNCSDPNTIITWEKFNAVDLSLFPDKVRGYITGSNGINKSLIPKYKEAAAGKIPWEMLAVLHRREGGGGATTSVLNGSALCNNNDNSSCAACGCPGPNCGKPDNPLATRENDLKCGVALILKKAGRVDGTLTNNQEDFETIKKTFGKYAGGATGCYDATYHTTAWFDQVHSEMWKSGIDCISMQGNCNPACVTDATKSPRSPRGCCTIKIYKRGQAPAGFNPRGSFCNNIQRSACKIAEDSTTATYKYKPCTTISDDPCGALQPQDRPGVLTLYAWLKKAQETDASLR